MARILRKEVPAEEARGDSLELLTHLQNATERILTATALRKQWKHIDPLGDKVIPLRNRIRLVELQYRSEQEYIDESLTRYDHILTVIGQAALFSPQNILDKLEPQETEEEIAIKGTVPYNDEGHDISYKGGRMSLETEAGTLQVQYARIMQHTENSPLHVDMQVGLGLPAVIDTPISR